MSDLSWLDTIILVNESGGGDDLEPGAVDLFRNIDDACAYLEPWWVEERHGLAFTGAGEEVIFGVDGFRVVVDGYEPRPDGHRIVLGWLRRSARAVLDARRHKAAKGKLRLRPMEAEGVVPASFEDLVAYVGFTR